MHWNFVAIDGVIKNQFQFRASRKLISDVEASVENWVDCSSVLEETSVHHWRTLHFRTGQKLQFITGEHSTSELDRNFSSSLENTPLQNWTGTSVHHWRTLHFITGQTLQFGSLTGFRTVTVPSPGFVATRVATFGLPSRIEYTKFVPIKFNVGKKRRALGQWYSAWSSRTPKCNSSSTLYPQSCWCTIQVIHSL
jgi:hypothetical protein